MSNLIETGSKPVGLVMVCLTPEGGSHAISRSVGSPPSRTQCRGSRLASGKHLHGRSNRRNDHTRGCSVSLRALRRCSVHEVEFTGARVRDARNRSTRHCTDREVSMIATTAFGLLRPLVPSCPDLIRASPRGACAASEVDGRSKSGHDGGALGRRRSVSRSKSYELRNRDSRGRWGFHDT